MTLRGEWRPWTLLCVLSALAVWGTLALCVLFAVSPTPLGVTLGEIVVERRARPLPYLHTLPYDHIRRPRNEGSA